MEFFVFKFQIFLLILFRITGMFLASPILSSNVFPIRAKFGLIFLVTIVIFPLVNEYIPSIPDNMVEYGFMIIIEVLIGLAFGFIVTLIFNTFQLAGQFFSVQMGFGASMVFDPLSQISLPLMGQYLYLVAVLIFLNLKGPMYLIREIYESFGLVSSGNFFNGSFLHDPNFGLITMFGKMFSIALRISIPILGTLLITSISLGMIGKAAPQMNLLLIGFPISISIGFFIIIAVIPLLAGYFSDFLFDLFDSLWKLMVNINRQGVAI